MDKLPSISIIIPSHNAANFLPDAVNSLFEQNVPHMEIILVDDHSNDHTESLISKWANKIRIIRSTCGSPAAARNTGLKYSRSEFVSFLDADDLWAPDRLLDHLNFHTLYPELDFSQGYTRKIFHETALSSRPRIPRDYAAHLNPNPGSFLFRRDALVKMGGFDETLRFGEDIDLWLRIRAAGLKGAVFEKVVLLYRMHADNMTNFQAADHHDLLNVLHKSVLRQGKHPRMTPLNARLPHLSDSSRYFPLVSAIVSYTRDLPIEDTLHSIAEQDYPSIEIIIVVCEPLDKKLMSDLPVTSQLKNTKIVKINAEGIANTFNLGVEAARGEFITFVQAGDVWSQDRLRNQTGLLLYNPDLGVTLGDIHVVIDPLFDDPKMTTRYLIPPWDSLGSALIRREALNLVGNLDVSFKDGAAAEWLSRFSYGLAHQKYPMMIRIPRVVHYQRFENCSHFEIKILSQNNITHILHKAIKRRRKLVR